MNMNMNTERIVWALVVVFLLYFTERSSSMLSDYEMLEKNWKISSNLQTDLINDMVMSRESALQSRYSQGFEEGKSSALVTFANDKEGFLSYKDGYHAAIKQFNFRDESEEVPVIRGKALKPQLPENIINTKSVLK